MLIAFLSDPHANLAATEVVLEDVARVSPDAAVCLGDFVGYGAEPNEVVELLRSRVQLSLVGNHDLAALGRVDISAFNRYAQMAAVWTSDNLKPQTSDFLEGLSADSQFEGVALAHGSPRSPVDEYIIEQGVALMNFLTADFEVAAVGHTHVPIVFLFESDRIAVRTPVAGEPLVCGSGRVILNPGSIGQPRDGDPRASWATWDTETRTYTLHRCEYPVSAAQQSIRAAGLPAVLADRLSEGY